MNRIRKYSSVLGVKGTVNSEELKRLYRAKAKRLHPDRNSSPASHEQFVLLKEAFEFYNDLLTKVEDGNQVNQFQSKKYPERYRKETWNVGKRMAAQKRAAERKKMKFDQFEKLGYYRTLNKLFYAFDLLRFVLSLVLLFCLPVFLFIQDQFRGLIVALFVQFITYRVWSRAIKRFIPYGKSKIN